MRSSAALFAVLVQALPQVPQAFREPKQARFEQTQGGDLDSVSAVQIEVTQFTRAEEGSLWTGPNPDQSTWGKPVKWGNREAGASASQEEIPKNKGEIPKKKAEGEGERAEDAIKPFPLPSDGRGNNHGHHHHHQPGNNVKANRTNTTKIGAPDMKIEIIHTRGHFNSMIVILVFLGLAIISIMAYCCVLFNSKDSEESAARPDKKEAAHEDTRLKDHMAARDRRRSQEGLGVDMKLSDAMAARESRMGSQASMVTSTLSKAERPKRGHWRPRDSDIDDSGSESEFKGMQSSISDQLCGPMEQQRRRRLSSIAKKGSISQDADVGAVGSQKVRRGTWSTTTKIWGMERWNPEESEETMSAFAFVVNVVADLCPSGFLSISYGMDGTGYLWSLVIMVVFYVLCVYTMWCCGRTCEISGETNFSSQWALVIGPGGSWIPSLVIVIVAFGALLCYACYFGDLLEEVMPALGLHVPRYACLISFSLFPALPLCLLKNLSALAYSSFFAFLALVYTAVVMIIRCGDGTYGEGGHYYNQLEDELLPALPQGKNMLKIGARSLLFINILAMAFHCHCNACKYYRELRGTTPRHFRNCTVVAMGIAAVLYGVIGYAGFKTFGTASSGTILKNYSLEDMPVNVARVLISLSLVASYAIMFSALREAFIGMLKHIFSTGSFDLVWRQDVLSAILVALVTVCGVVSQDSGLVDGFVGAFCGNAIIYIIPCLLYCATVKAFLVKKRNRPGLAFSTFLIFLGCALAIAGCVCLVIFEVENPEDRAVQHHWVVDGGKNVTPAVPHHGKSGYTTRPRHLFPHGHASDSRPVGRHVWAMR